MAALLQVNEKSTMIVTVSFFDDDDVAVIPTAATYRIDTATGSVIKASGAIGSLATSVDIEVTSAQNAIVTAGTALEEHVLTVEFDYGASRHGTDEYRWLVKNLQGVT